MSQTTLISRGKKILNKSGELFTWLKNGIKVHFVDHSRETEEPKDYLSERNLSFYFLSFTGVALFLKLIHPLLKTEWLLTITSVVGWLLAFPITVWSSLCSVVVAACGAVWSLSGLGLPILCGIAMTVVTWYTIFLDSCVPGIFPPSPLTPKKSRIWFPQYFHLGYIVAVVNGLVLALLMYIGSESGVE